MTREELQKEILLAMTREELQKETDAIREKLLALFPIGSEWYDCVADAVGIVELHFPPRGVILKMTATEDYNRYSFDSLLTGCLIPTATPATSNYYDEFQERLAQEDALYRELLGDRKVWD